MKRFGFILTGIVFTLFFYACTKDEGIRKNKSEDGSGEYTYTAGDRESGSFGSTSGSGGDGGTSVGDTSQMGTPEPGQVTAAEWNDLAHWDFWTNLGQNQEFTGAQANWQINPFSRYSFLVRDKNNLPLVDAVVKLKSGSGEVLWTAHTDNQGRAELWLDLYKPLDIHPKAVLYCQEESVEITEPLAFSAGINEVQLPVDGSALITADILFVVDATGSMGDEINYLKSELLSVINRAEDLNSQLNLRLGSVFYRDTEDEYLTRVTPFSETIESTVDFIKQQEANGGGDFPEAVHTALSTALTQMSWSESARARLLFLILDAPPHNSPGIVVDIQKAIQDASEQGIKIVPVTASGIDKDTEFLMRFMAIATNGTYVFITDDSGIGGDHLEATVGDYEVELLNDLLVRLIDTYTR